MAAFSIRLIKAILVIPLSYVWRFAQGSGVIGGMHCEGYPGVEMTIYGLIMKGVVLKYMGTANTAPKWLFSWYSLRGGS